MKSKHAIGSLVLGLATTVALGGCKEQPSDKPGQHDASSSQPSAGGMGDKHEHAASIGETTMNGHTLKAQQDEPITAGGEGAFDLNVTGYPAGQKPKAVRFWVGVESGEGSVKAKASEETPDNWHSHVEVPKPMPEGAKFWAEVEPATGETFKASFNLNK